MKYTHLIQIVFVLFLTNGCSIFVPSKHQLSFQCGDAMVSTLKPPKGTYKCQIKLLKNCSPNDSIQILSNDKIQKRLKFETDVIGVLMNNDWYKGELGVQYIPYNKSTDNSNELLLEVVFYTN